MKMGVSLASQKGSPSLPDSEHRCRLASLRIYQPLRGSRFFRPSLRDPRVSWKVLELSWELEVLFPTERAHLTLGEQLSFLKGRQPCQGPFKSG